MKGHPYEQGFDIRSVPEKLSEPLRWPARKRVFVNSMSDLFHPEVPTEYIVRVARVMATADWHFTSRSEAVSFAVKSDTALKVEGAPAQ